MTADDTLLDLLASQARANPPLSDADTDRLLAAARAGDGGEGAATLTRHLLGVALDTALRLRAGGDDVTELYQEGAVAVVAAVNEYVAGDGGAAGLREAVGRAVATHVRGVQGGERRRREDDEAFVRDSRRLDLVAVALRQRLGRQPTTDELAELLEWDPARVELVGSLVEDARRIHDETLIPFLDDDDPSEP